MKATYDTIADWYAGRMQEGGPGAWAFPPMLKLIGDVHDQHICDLACGEGRMARLLAQHGAAVVGIDQSSELIREAQKQEMRDPLGIRYVMDDAQTLYTLSDKTFDGVVCLLALMDIPDLEATLSTVQRILKPGGWFTFLITHPCFAAPGTTVRIEPDGAVVCEIRHYFTEGFWRADGAGRLIEQVGAYHRTLATYLNGLTAAGLTLTKVVEPRRDDDASEANPGSRIVPTLLLVCCVKFHCESK